MSYGSPQARPRSGKGGMFFIILLVVGAMIFFSSRGGQDSNQGQSPDEVLGSRDHEHEQIQKDIFGDGTFDRNGQQGRRMPTENQAKRSSPNNDWKMDDDVATRRDAKSPEVVKKNSQTTNGDWAIEDVDNKKKENQFKFSNEGKKDGAATESGSDWSIDDVKKAKKTENGDWTIEEADPKKGK